MQQQPLELIDIYGVWYHPWWQQAWFVYPSILACVAVIVFLCYWIYKRFFYVEKVQLPYEKALEALQSLRGDDLSPKLFYIRLTEILKEYLQELYHEQFVGTTDTEMIRLLERTSSASPKIMTQVEEILDGVTLIKFANHKAAQEQMSKALTSALQIVEETTVRDL